jgi:acyl-CoA synthetase (AMP-forming)/AMP-acid ligase II
LNPSYSPPEVKFYLEDTKPILLLLPRFDSLKSSDPIRKGAEAALAAARQVGIPAASFWIDHKKERVRVRVISPSNSPKRVPYSSIVDPSPEDIALVLHTSGTTGRPKSVPLSHHNLVTTTNNIIKTYDLVKEDRSYLVMPLFHVHGLLAGLLAPLRSGGSVVVPDKFSAGQFWNDFIRTKCNWYTAGTSYTSFHHSRHFRRNVFSSPNYPLNLTLNARPQPTA